MSIVQETKDWIIRIVNNRPKYVDLTNKNQIEDSDVSRVFHMRMEEWTSTEAHDRLRDYSRSSGMQTKYSSTNHQK